MHIALANFYLLSVTGPPMPPDIKSTDMEKTVTSKADVIAFLQRSLDAVKTARAQLKPGETPYAFSPKLRRVESETLGITVPVTHAVPVWEEVLGVSNGESAQTFRQNGCFGLVSGIEF